MTFDDRIEQLALLLSGLNKRVAVLELRVSPQVNAPSPTPEAPAPPVATPTVLAGPSSTPDTKLLEMGLKAPPDALAAYQRRCKARLVAKAQENLDLLPYWIQHALQCGWIKAGEGIEALLTNDAEVFWLEPNADPADPNNNVKLQFENMAGAVAKLAESNCPF